MKYLVMENKGEAAPEAFLLMGASTKRGSSEQIGMFGTGFKYAIAVLMREKVSLLIVSGQKRYTFGTEPVTLREQTFDRVTVREGRHKPDPTQFTTEMGPDWELAGALRELISNTFDEPNAEVFISGEIMDRPGYTRVYVQLTDAVKTVYTEFDRYFTFRRQPLASGEGWAIYKPWGPGTRIYRRGVLVHENSEKPACFDYQDDALAVREDRRSESSECERSVARIINRMGEDHLSLLLDFLSGTPDTFEGDDYYIDWYCDGVGAKAASLINGRVVITRRDFELFGAELSGSSHLILPEKWVKLLKAVKGMRTICDVISAPRLKGFEPVDEADLGSVERYRFREALKVVARVGITLEESKLSLFRSDDENAPLGNAFVSSGEILINCKVLMQPVREVVKVLFEEYIHVYSQNSDYSRGFQNALLEHWVRSIEFCIPKLIAAEPGTGPAEISSAA